MSDLLDRVVAAYAMTDADKAHLARLLATAYLTAKASAYQRAEATAAHVLRLKHPWRPTARDAAQAQEQATEWAQSIAETYETMLTGLVQKELARQQERESEEVQRGLIGGLINAAALAKGIAGGVQAFVEWKSEQIENVTTGSGANDGTSQWIDDVLAESKSGTLDVSGDPNGVRVRVIPESSSNDACKQYAGHDYSLEESESLPTWPMHPNCPHQIEVYVV